MNLKSKTTMQAIIIILCLCIFVTSNMHKTLESIMPTLTNLLINMESITALILTILTLQRKQKEPEPIPKRKIRNNPTQDINNKISKQINTQEQTKTPTNNQVEVKNGPIRNTGTLKRDWKL